MRQGTVGGHCWMTPNKLLNCIGSSWQQATFLQRFCSLAADCRVLESHSSRPAIWSFVGVQPPCRLCCSLRWLLRVGEGVLVHSVSSISNPETAYSAGSWYRRLCLRGALFGGSCLGGSKLGSLTLPPLRVPRAGLAAGKYISAQPQWSQFHYQFETRSRGGHLVENR